MNGFTLSDSKLPKGLVDAQNSVVSLDQLNLSQIEGRIFKLLNCRFVMLNSQITDISDGNNQDEGTIVASKDSELSITSGTIERITSNYPIFSINLGTLRTNSLTITNI